MNKPHQAIFKKGSKTFFNSSLFFPSVVRKDVSVLYGFVRKADDLVDQLPQDKQGFYAFWDAYEQAAKGRPSGNPVIDDFTELSKTCHFDPQWVSAFLRSMEMDLKKKNYSSWQETLEYIYGSAEVIGLFMACILNLPKQSYAYAQLQGRAMQTINFIRDIQEDNGLGRQYLPSVESGLPDLLPQTAKAHPQEFIQFIQEQIRKYTQWQTEAAQGYAWIPLRYRIPIMTAAQMYNWTALRISQDPWIIYRKKVKPKTTRIVLQAFYNILRWGKL